MAEPPWYVVRTATVGDGVELRAGEYLFVVEPPAWFGEALDRGIVVPWSKPEPGPNRQQRRREAKKPRHPVT